MWDWKITARGGRLTVGGVEPVDGGRDDGTEAEVLAAEVEVAEWDDSSCEGLGTDDDAEDREVTLGFTLVVTLALVFAVGPRSRVLRQFPDSPGK